MKKKLLFLFFSTCINVIFGQNITIIDSIKKGKYGVGFKNLLIHDYSRTYDNSKKYRQIELTIWYPASKSNKNKSLTYKDYVKLFHEDTLAAIKEFKKQPLEYGASDQLLNNILSAKCLASKGIKPLKGSFPLILFAPGVSEKSYSNAILFEMLASNGYIVASTSFLSAFSSKVIDAPRIFIEPQIRDLEFILSYMKDFKNVDFENIGIIGHSAGGNSALLMSLRNFNIDAVALLDASFIGMENINDFSYFNPKYLRTPFLHFISGYWRKKKKMHENFNNSFFQGIKRSDAYMLDMYDLLHQSFVSDMHLRFDNSGIDYKKLGLSFDEDMSDKSYQLISDTLLNFFNIYLKKQKIDFEKELKSSKKNFPNFFDYEGKFNNKK